MGTNTDIARIDRLISKAIDETNAAMAMTSNIARLNRVSAAMQTLSKDVEVTADPPFRARIRVGEMFELDIEGYDLTYIGLDHIADSTAGATENIGLRLMQEARRQANIAYTGMAPMPAATAFAMWVSYVADTEQLRQWPERNLTEWKYTLVVDRCLMYVTTWMRSDRQPTAGALLQAMSTKVPLGFDGDERYADFAALAEAIWDDEDAARQACLDIKRTMAEELEAILSGSLDEEIYRSRIITGCL